MEMIFFDLIQLALTIPPVLSQLLFSDKKRLSSEIEDVTPSEKSPQKVDHEQTKSSQELEVVQKPKSYFGITEKWVPIIIGVCLD